MIVFREILRRSPLAEFRDVHRAPHVEPVPHHRIVDEADIVFTVDVLALFHQPLGVILHHRTRAEVIEAG